MARSAVARPFRASASAPASSSGSSSTFADNGAGHGRLHFFSMTRTHHRRHAAGVLLTVLLATAAVDAQWKNLPMDGVPMRDGKPDMAAPAPRTSSGRLDLSGIYQPSYRYFANLAADIGLPNVPMTDEARKI